MATHEPGSEIAGYRIESLIGRGGMAVVYRAEDTRLGRKVALKLLTPQLADSEQFRQRFIRESRLAASLDHPNIVPIYEAGEADGQLFIAMRYVLGSDLKGLLAEQGGRLPVDWALRLFGQIGDALDSAHRAGLVHRDVKPGNILVATGEHPRRARGDHVYLTDFGLTKRTSELSGGLTGTGHFLGTVDYVSPEQIQGKPVGAATDIYALGCVLYECLTGQLPFRRDDDAALLWAHLVEMPPPVTAIRPEIPGAVGAVVARAMAKDPADRYEACEELLSELELALDMPEPVSSPGGRHTGQGGRHTGEGQEVTRITGLSTGGDGVGYSLAVEAPAGPAPGGTPVPGLAPTGAVADPPVVPATSVADVEVPAPAGADRSRPVPEVGTGEPPGDPPPPGGGGPVPSPHPAPDGGPPAIPPPAPTARWRNRWVALVAGLVLLTAVAGVLVYRELQPAPQAQPTAPSSSQPAPAPPPATEPPAAAVPIPSLGPTVPVGESPNFVVASPNGRQLYIASPGADAIFVVDTAADQVTATIDVSAGPPQFLAFSPDGRTVYISVWDDARTIAAISVLDTTTLKITTTIPVRTRPFLGAVTPDGKRIFVPNHDTGTVSVIDTSTDKLITEFSVAANPHYVAFTPDGTRAYIANHESNVVSVVDASTYAVLTTLPVPESPHSVVVHPTRPLAIVASYNAASVSAIDTNTNTVIKTIPVEENPQHVAWSADGRFAYITNDGSNSISVIDVDSLAVTARIPTGSSPTSMAVLPDGKRGYVSNLDDGTLTVLNLAG